MGFSNSFWAGLYTKLQGGTALTALLSGTTAIYHLQAPDNSTLPYIVFSTQAGGPENITSSDMRNLLIYVRGYAASPTTAGSIDAQIENLLHKQALSVSGYTNYWSVKQQDVSLVETPPNSNPVYSYGGIYQFRLDD